MIIVDIKEVVCSRGPEYYRIQICIVLSIVESLELLRTRTMYRHCVQYLYYGS